MGLFLKAMLGMEGRLKEVNKQIMKGRLKDKNKKNMKDLGGRK